MADAKTGFRRESTTRGFKSASGLLQSRIRTASSSRGFAESRLLTRWSEIAGDEIAQVAQPVKVTFGRGGLGATLTLLTTGPQAPLIEMQKEIIRERVNACYGYSAIARIVITQTAPTGFAEGQAAFTPAPRKPKSGPDPQITARAATETEQVENADLKQALTRLAENVLSKAKR